MNIATPVAAFDSVIAQQRALFETGETKSAEWRRDQLSALIRMLEEKEAVFANALRNDLGKSATESFISEIGFTIAEANYARKKLGRWMKPARVGVPLLLQPGKGRIRPEPLGVALIIAPWNYPLQLALSPLASALSAGNCAVIKPSEIAPHVSEALATVVPDYFDPGAVAIVEGGVSETTALLEQQWDKIFYTGNGKVGRIIMEAAAKHLTPVTLELGGKSPTVVDESANLSVAARRIVWGKFLNAGQTCVAPDYILAHAAVHDALLSEMMTAVHDMYGADPRQSPDYGRIINDKHYERICGFLGSGQTVIGGDHDAGERYIAPTILRDVDPGSPAMQEEIFGPVLPVLKIDSIDDAIAFITARDKPLALYVFAGDTYVQRKIVAETSSGSAAINDAVMHLAAPDLPFGGVGESGTGAYHGVHGFHAFSHRKAVFKMPTWPDLPARYPPMKAWKEKLIRKVL